MPKFQEINLINGVTAAGIRQVPHQQTAATAEAIETGSGSTVLIADVQSIGQHLINTIDGTYEWLRYPERGPLQPRNSRRRLIDLLTSNKQPSGPKPKLIDLLTPDSWIPASQKVQSTLIYPDVSPWKEHQAATPVRDDSPLLVQMTAAERKFGLSDARLVARYVRRYWSPYAVAGASTGMALMSFSAYRILYARTLQVLADSALVPGAALLIKGAVARLIVAMPLSVGVMLLGERLGARLSSRIASDIRYDLFTHLQRLPPTFHKEARVGDLLARFSGDMEKIELALGKEFAAGLGDIVMLLVNFSVMVHLSLPLTLVSLVPIVLMRRPVLRAAKHFSETGYVMQKQKGLMTNAVQEGLRALPLAESFGIGKNLRGYFGDELRKLEDKNAKALFGRALFMHTAASSYLLLQLVTLGTGTLFVLSGGMSVGGLLASMAVTENFFFSYSQLTKLRVTQWIDAAIGLRRLDELFQQQRAILDAPGAATLPSFQHALRFEHVTFSYNSQANSHGGESKQSATAQQQLTDINLTIEAGQFIAFVGPSGAGKSTIFNLLMRFYDVSDGRITLDGHDLRDITLASLRAQMGVVLQETFLFNTTIFDNIRIVKPEATEVEVFAAAQAAELHDFIVSLPDGYQTIVGEGGGRLSGGQRQRISIARALLVNPAILLLDEATSSLDADTAAAINATLQRVAAYRTVIMITHHLPSVVNADQIFVLKQGQLVEQGNHETLLAQGGLYHQLWLMQGHGTSTPRMLDGVHP
jgi:ATP-binding cassette subfamily B protein